jgi:hypothetical protein
MGPDVKQDGNREAPREAKQDLLRRSDLVLLVNFVAKRNPIPIGPISDGSDPDQVRFRSG